MMIEEIEEVEEDIEVQGKADDAETNYNKLKTYYEIITTQYISLIKKLTNIIFHFYKSSIITIFMVKPINY